MSSFSKKLNKHKQIWSSLFTNHKSIYRLLSLINRPNIWKIISISEKNGFKKSAGIINLLEKIHLRLDRWEEFLHRNLALGTICRCTFTQTCTKPLTFKHIISYEHAEPILAENIFRQPLDNTLVLQQFLPRDAMHSADYALARCPPSVRLSVTRRCSV